MAAPYSVLAFLVRDFGMEESREECCKARGPVCFGNHMIWPQRTGWEGNSCFRELVQVRVLMRMAVIISGCHLLITFEVLCSAFSWMAFIYRGLYNREFCVYFSHARQRRGGFNSGRPVSQRVCPALQHQLLPWSRASPRAT